MATIIRTSRKAGTDRGSAFNFDDMAEQADQYLEDVRGQAEAIVAEARAEAALIRDTARAEGRREAEQGAERIVETRIAETVLPAITQLVAQVAAAKETWIVQWERELLRLATAIAQKVIRREIEHEPEITLDMIRESLAMAAGSPQLRVRLNSADYEVLAPHVEQLAEHVGTVGAAQIVADDSMSRGGCRVESEFGVIDQQIETQIARISEELS